MDLTMVLTLGLLIFSSSYFAFLFVRKSFAERTIITYLAIVFQILITGYASSLVGRFGDSLTWLICAAISALVVNTFGFRFGRRHDFQEDSLLTENNTYLPLYPLLFILGITVALIAVANLCVVLFTAPHNFDSHTCHLARTAHFLQQQSLDWYPTNMWAQVSHPRNHPIMLGFAWKIGGENSTQMVNFVAWLMSGVIVFATVRNINRNGGVSLVTALLSMLLVNGIMISTTTQNDLLLATHAGSVIFLLSAYYRSGDLKFVWATAVPLFVCFGIKASAVLLVPSFVIVAIYLAYFRYHLHGDKFLKPCLCFGSALLLAGVASSPTGYLQNIYRFSHPLGAKHVRSSHTLEDLPVREAAIETGKNVLRCIFDSTALEGVKPNGEVDQLRRVVAGAVGEVLESVGCRLEENNFSKHSFSLDRLTRNHEDYSWWGVASCLLIWPSLIYCFVYPGKNNVLRGFTIAFFAFLIFQGFAQYDPWRGRYFGWTTTIFMVPVAGCIIALLKGRIGQTSLMIAAVLICICSCRAILYRTNSFLMSKGNNTSVFKMDRAQQLSRNLPEMAEVIRNYERAVPENSNIILALSGNHFAYPFYGPTFSKRITYASPTDKGLQSVQGQPDFVVFSDEGDKIKPKNTDLPLGPVQDQGNIYLRDLKSQ